MGRIVTMNAALLNPFLKESKRKQIQARLNESIKADLVTDAITLARLTRRH